MKHARLVSGEYQNCFGSLDNIAHDDGSINWGVAFRADPGVKKCPGCGEFYWNEARIMECINDSCRRQFGAGLPEPQK